MHNVFRRAALQGEHKAEFSTWLFRSSGQALRRDVRLEKPGKLDNMLINETG
jgi:hypothetical protein